MIQVHVPRGVGVRVPPWAPLILDICGIFANLTWQICQKNVEQVPHILFSIFKRRYLYRQNIEAEVYPAKAPFLHNGFQIAIGRGYNGNITGKLRHATDSAKTPLAHFV